MNDLMTYAFSVFMGFFAIMNPIANTPVFLGLTANELLPVKLFLHSSASPFRLLK